MKIDWLTFVKDIEAKGAVEFLSYSQAERVIGLNTGVLYRICNIEAQPSVLNYVKICAWLGVSLYKYVK